MAARWSKLVRDKELYFKKDPAAPAFRGPYFTARRAEFIGNPAEDGDMYTVDEHLPFCPKLYEAIDQSREQTQNVRSSFSGSGLLLCVPTRAKLWGSTGTPLN